jgi:hypothetical protein
MGWDEKGEFLFLLEGVKVAELFSNAEEHFALVDVAAIPLDQLASGRDVFGDRLLGQNMLACGQGLLNVIRLGWNGQSYDNSVDV